MALEERPSPPTCATALQTRDAAAKLAKAAQKAADKAAEEEVKARKAAEREAEKAAKLVEKAKRDAERGPIKPRTAESYYTDSSRERTASDNPGLSGAELSKIVKANFKGLSAKERAPFEASASEDKARYERECEEAGFSPNGGKRAKTGEASAPPTPPSGKTPPHGAEIDEEAMEEDAMPSPIAVKKPEGPKP